jgi:Zn-dependent protease with chaperone function
MMLAYGPRLACIVLSCFFLVWLAVSALTAVLTPYSIRVAGRLAPRSATHLVLFIRLMPFLLALAISLGLCVPSYLWFEPERIDEQVGSACLLLALLGALICLVAFTRATRAGLRSLMFVRRCRQSGQEKPNPEALVIESSHPFLALTGVVHPRVVISKGIIDLLSEEELAVVMSHEHAHRLSQDNLKRLCMSLTPGGTALERAWVRFAEYAADEAAVSGDARRSLALASALVRVARLGVVPPPSAVAISFLGDVNDLPERVERLLARPSGGELPERTSWRMAGPALITALCLAAMALNPASLRLVQSALEGLVR